MCHPVRKNQFKFDFKDDIPHKFWIHTFSSMNIWTRRPLHSEDNKNGLLTHASSKSGREDSQMLAFGYTTGNMLADKALITQKCLFIVI